MMKLLLPQSHKLFNLKSWQSEFVGSQSRHPAMVSAWGTGKDLAGIGRMMQFAVESPDNLGVCFRKEYRDLADSTIKDFESYTGLEVDSEGNCSVPCASGHRSIIMFRHIEQLNSLQNLNLGFFWINQAEEMESSREFWLLTGRLRRNNVQRRSGFITANACGHNWIWKGWLDPERTTDPVQFPAWQAQTMDNADVLPADYILSLDELRNTDPDLFKRFVLNDHEVLGDSFALIPYSEIIACLKLGFIPDGGRILILDIAAAQTGDLTVFTILQKCGADKFKQVFIRSFQGQDTMKTCGMLFDLQKEWECESVVADEGGLGITFCQRVNEVMQEKNIKFTFIRFNGGSKPMMENSGFKNRRTEGYYSLRDLIRQKKLELMEHKEQLDQLSHIRYDFSSNGERIIESKEKMRARGLKSPDFADALMMGVSCASTLKTYEAPKTSSDEFWGRVRRDLRKTSGQPEFRKVDV